MIHPTAVIADTADVSPTAEIGPHVVVGERVVIEDDVTVFAGAYVGKPPKVAGIVKNKPKAMPGTFIGAGSVIGANAVIYQGTVLGESVLIGDGATVRENCTIGHESIVGNNTTMQNDVVVGDRVRIVDLSHVTAHVTIADDVFWSVGVLSMNDNGFGSGGELRPPHVAQGASIGGGAVLLPGVHVGEDAIIGAGSVVTKDVASSTKVMGVPAREKRESDREVSESYYFGSFYPEELPDRPYSEGELYEELGR